jgi:outer membrane protein OmpA-like peptidoglycan-associated protein
MKSMMKATGMVALSVLLASNAALAHSDSSNYTGNGCGKCTNKRDGYRPYTKGLYSTYYNSLSSYYTHYATQKSGMGADPQYVQYLYDKAARAQKGQTRVAYVANGCQGKEDLRNARKMLVANSTRHNKGMHPHELAAAHFYYDCWATGVKYGSTCTQCRDHFYKHINNLINAGTSDENDLSVAQSKRLTHYLENRHLVGSLYFAFDKYKQPLNSDTESILACAAMMAEKGYILILSGNADSTGTKLYNSDLSSRRAKTVRHMLMGKGVSAEGIDLVTFGESRVTSEYGCSTYDKSANRRVEIYAVKKQTECGR